MSFGTQQSYRIGDHARSQAPDGDHIALVTSIEPATTKAGLPQIKVVSQLVTANNRQHTWYYLLGGNDPPLWKYFQDLLALGADPNVDLGPPGPQYVDFLRQGMLNQAVDINIRTAGDFQNVKVLRLHQAGPNNGQSAPGGGPSGFPVQTAQPAVAGGTLEGAFQHGNEPAAVHPQGGSPWPNGGLPMGSAPQTGFAPAPSTAVTDAASLFKRG